MKTKYLGHELRTGVTAAAHKFCSALSLPPVNIYWDAATSTASMSASGSMRLSDVADDAVVSVAVFDRYVGYVIHELLHRKYSDFRQSYQNDYVATLHNAVEDIWIERTGIAAGLTGNIEGLLTGLVNGMVAEAMISVTNWADPAQYPFALAVFGRRYAHNVPLAAGLEPIFIEASSKIDACLNSTDTMAVAQWVYDQLRALPKAPPKPQARQGDGEGKPTQGTAQAPNAVTRPANVEPQNSAPDGAGGIGGNFNADAAQGKDRSHIGRVHRHETKLTAGAALKYSVKRLFENTGIDEFQPRRKVGSINTAALSSIATGNVRVFKRRVELDGIDSAVVILLDVSGSMDENSNPFIGRAVLTCAALLETLTAAGVKVAVVTFCADASVVKHFDGNAKKALEDLGKMKTWGMTNDYYAVRLCHEMLHKRSEARKVLFVVTDGDGDTQATTAQVAAGTRLGITTIGIGLQLSIKHVYPNSVTVRNIDDLATTSFKQIKLAA